MDQGAEQAFVIALVQADRGFIQHVHHANQPGANLACQTNTLRLSGQRAKIAEKVLKEIGDRLKFLVNVGLNYLTLSRSAETLSGGEAQRIRLASQIVGSGVSST